MCRKTTTGPLHKRNTRSMNERLLLNHAVQLLRRPLIHFRSSTGGRDNTVMTSVQRISALTAGSLNPFSSSPVVIVFQVQQGASTNSGVSPSCGACNCGDSGLQVQRAVQGILWP